MSAQLVYKEERVRNLVVCAQLGCKAECVRNLVVSAQLGCECSSHNLVVSAQPSCVCATWLCRGMRAQLGGLRATTGWRRLIGPPKLQIIFHKRAAKYRSLLPKMTYKDKGSYESSPPYRL